MKKINEYIVPYHWSWEGFYKEVYERPVKLILAEFNPNDHILDVGCGDGKLTSLIAPKVRQVTAIDHQEYPLKFARLIFKKIGIKNTVFRTGDITKLTFKENNFDKVTCFDVIEHIKKEEAVQGIKEVVRVLKPGGKVYLTTPNRRELRGRIFGHKIIEKHYYEYAPNEIKEMLNPYVRDIEIRGYYIPFPIPKAEHFSNIIPLRYIFRWLIKAGYKYPNVSAGMLITGTKK